MSAILLALAGGAQAENLISNGRYDAGADGWTLELADGWVIRPAEREGDFILARGP